MSLDFLSSRSQVGELSFSFTNQSVICSHVQRLGHLLDSLFLTGSEVESITAKLESVLGNRNSGALLLGVAIYFGNIVAQIWGREE